MLTVIVAVTTLPPRPASALLVEACTSKLPRAGEVGRGRELQPGVPLSEGDEVAVVDRVVPSFWNRVPLVMLVILKCVTSVLSAALRLMTRPVVVCVSSLVVAVGDRRRVGDRVDGDGRPWRCRRRDPRQRRSVEACTSKLTVSPD